MKKQPLIILSSWGLIGLSIIGAAGCKLLPDERPSSATSSEIVFGGSGYPVTVCDASYAKPKSGCVIAGKGSNLRLKGIIVGSDRIWVGGELSAGDDGRIDAIGCSLPSSNAVVLDCPGVLVSPGFINLHEHIDYSYAQPATPLTQRFEHRNEWRGKTAAERGFDYGTPKDERVRLEMTDRAMLRHLLSGTTALVTTRNDVAFVRNLGAPRYGLGPPGSRPIFDATFPLRDFSPKSPPGPSSPCPLSQIASLAAYIPTDSPFVAHVGEGINSGASLEIDCVLDMLKGMTRPSAFVHGIAATPSQIQRLRAQNVSVVLSPRSNFQLYGATAPIPQMHRAGINLTLGTDWAPSGSLTMLEEMRCLASYNTKNLNGVLSWADIHRMATVNGAKAIGLQDVLGSLAPGQYADMVLIDTQGTDSLGEALQGAALREVIAVFIGGKGAMFPTAWSGNLLATLPECAPDPRMLCGSPRTVCGAVHPRTFGGDLLKSTTYTIDDSRLCVHQSTTDCVPSRPGAYTGIPTSTDQDGDGVPDSQDNCPAIFNPPFPFTANTQPDMQSVAEQCRARGP